MSCVTVRLFTMKLVSICYILCYHEVIYHEIGLYLLCLTVRLVTMKLVSICYVLCYREVSYHEIGLYLSCLVLPSRLRPFVLAYLPRIAERYLPEVSRSLHF